MRKLIVFILFFISVLLNAQEHTLPLTSTVINVDTTLAGDDTRPGSVAIYLPKLNHTVYVWAGDQENFHPYITVYDHNTGDTLFKRKIIGFNPYTDRHNYPKIGLLPNGHLFCAFGSHADNFQFSTQDTIGNYDSWTQTLSDSPEATYPQIITSQLTGRVYVFYSFTNNWDREGTDYVPHRPIVYIYTDDGINWSDPVNAIDRAIADGVDDDPFQLNELYFSGFDRIITPSGEERFYFAWILAGGETHDDYHKNVYAAYFTPIDGRWHSVDNSFEGDSIAGVSVMDSPVYDFLVYDSGDTTGNSYATPYVNHISVGNDGRPLLGAYEINDTIKFFKWKGTEWDTVTLTNYMLDDTRAGNSIVDENDVRWHVRWGGSGELAMRSSDGYAWEYLVDFSGTHNGTYTQVCQVENPANIESFAWIREQNRVVDTNYMFIAGDTSVTDTANSLLIDSKTLTMFGDTISIWVGAYAKIFGYYDFIDTVTSEITLHVPSALTIIDSTINAVDGAVEFTVVMPDSAGLFRIEAYGTGLDTTFKILRNVDSATFIIPACGKGILFDGTNEARYDHTINPNRHLYAVEILGRNFKEVNAYSAVVGEGQSNNFWMLDYVNGIAFRDGVGTFRPTGISNVPLKVAGTTYRYRFYCDSLIGRAEVWDSLGTNQQYAGNIDTTAAMSINEIGGGYASLSNNAYMEWYHLKVYDLTPYRGLTIGGLLDWDTISYLTPVHEELFEEGIGNTLYPDIGIEEATITLVRVDTTWLNVTCTNDLVITVNGYDAACYNSANGYATVSVEGGTAPYTYLWSTTETGTTVFNLDTGWVSVTVTDAVDSVLVDSVHISQPTELTQSGVIVNDQDNGGTGSITITIEGGVLPYEFLWSNLATTQNLSNLTAGNYTITIEDYNGCLSEDSYQVSNISTAVPVAAKTKLTILKGANNVLFLDRNGNIITR